MREKLIELLEADECPLLYVLGENMGALANYLIANGVRLETKQATSDKTSDESGYLYNVTHWMPLPEPPKEVDHAKE